MKADHHKSNMSKMSTFLGEPRDSARMAKKKWPMYRRKHKKVFVRFFNKATRKSIVKYVYPAIRKGEFEMENMFKPSEIAKTIEFSKKTILRWIEDGKITASKFKTGHLFIDVYEPNNYTFLDRVWKKRRNININSRLARFEINLPKIEKRDIKV